jgi:hypothetical protein
MNIEISWLKRRINGLWFIEGNMVSKNLIEMQFIRVVDSLVQTRCLLVIVLLISGRAFSDRRSVFDCISGLHLDHQKDRFLNIKSFVFDRLDWSMMDHQMDN